MNILALNSSPRVGVESKTEWMLDHLVQGMREAGAAVEVVALKDKKVRHCSGCFTCWTKTPGVCIHRDDMTRELLPKWLAADMAVYASPLYHFTVNARMKAFVERTLPVFEPFMVEAGRESLHPERHEPPGAVVLSVAGFPEDSVFEQLSAYVRFLFRDKLRAEIYRPAAESLVAGYGGELREDVADAVRQAGRELVESGSVSQETQERIRRPVMAERATVHAMTNLFWKTCIAEGVTPREFSENGMVPRPDSVESFLTLMEVAFRPKAAADLHATMQFHFTGAVEGTCSLSFDNGTLTTAPEAHPSPDLTIDTPFDVWMDIITRKADGAEMFMQQKYTAEGDMNLLMKMGELFGK